MQNMQNSEIPAGWLGGFEESNPAYAYPNPDLSSLPMLGNMDNINLLQRQQAVLWPEFSWLTILGDPDSRCFQMFAPDISRLGYTDEGRVYSIICPQQGACSPRFGCLNVEVTVTGQRGWANENNRELAADMTVEGKIWFSRSALKKTKTKVLRKMFQALNLPFPFNKANAIRVNTFDPGNPSQPVFPLRFGETTTFASPDFAKHPEAWTVGNIQVEIGSVIKTGHDIVDEFNSLIMEVFNFTSGNMLASGNVLTWNVWFNHPELVDQVEWAAHAKLWRESIDADHGSPDGEGTTAKYFDGTPFKPLGNVVKEVEEKVFDFIKKHFKL
jgi:hypothetical protein